MFMTAPLLRKSGPYGYWPDDMPMRFKPIATMKAPLAHVERWLDNLAINAAEKRAAVADAIRCSGMTQGYTEVFFNNIADYTAYSNSTSEGSLLSGVNRQPVLPAFTIDLGQRGPGKTFVFEAMGVLSTTSTPNFTAQCRLGTTSGATFLSGTSVGVSAAITTASGVTNKWWMLKLVLTCYTAGIGSGNTTLSGAGFITSPGGFASPWTYPLEPTTPDTATWQSTIDLSATQYFNLSGTWSAASSSNSITCKSLLGYCVN